MAEDARAAAATAGATVGFYAALPVARDFDAAVEADSTAPLPDDWVLGLADVVTSTRALEEGRYKAVNTAGAAVISAVSNALGTLAFPFVFTGDGAAFAVAPGDAGKAAEALAATVAWVGAELGLALRAAAVSVGAVRAAGADLRVARVAASENVDYAMFTGGGRDWAEREMKAGRLALPPAPAGARPDLSGLTCRFRPIAAAHGTVLSVIVKPVGDAASPGFVRACSDVLALARTAPRGGHPVPVGGPQHRWPPGGLDIEARLHRGLGRSLTESRLRTAARSAVHTFFLRTGLRAGGVVPADYRRQLVENSDFRKFDDGLMMTIDCPPATADAIAARLAAAEAEGVARHGLHRQGEALVTCIVPAAGRPDHVHFVDGAAGGYAVAAAMLKSKEAEPHPLPSVSAGTRGGRAG
ncbi:DUF3095 domain-containing protein [Lichenibacterium dinghuense]|uniref:DUF3095 domain-containing protein n=1 Tax=Lichenibacterium dinghuense TaxID=2895977 RepID=UPI001F362101|nr:DUF3095 domain-containing protein [Lichenibacterium sp. 6Y81]